ncbi:MAG: hypothetical protein O7F69_12860 [Alphaproteobacteria bacterium]|nr:hypothetical protein [Alphaproteobacteria bacterium]
MLDGADHILELINIDIVYQDWIDRCCVHRYILPPYDEKNYSVPERLALCLYAGVKSVASTGMVA